MTEPAPASPAPASQGSARIRVFVSSTRKDLEDEHRAVVSHIDALGFEPVTMLKFSAEAQPTEAADAEKVRSCELFVLLLAHRYGESPAGKPESYTELEYEVARAARKPSFVFLVDDNKAPMFGTGPHRNIDDGDDWPAKYQRLQALKMRIRERNEVQPTWFETTTDLTAKVVRSLRDWSVQNQKPTEPGRQVAVHATGTAAANATLAGYRARVLEQHSHLPLVGFAKNVRVEIPLDELYVELHAVPSLDGKQHEFGGAEEADSSLRGMEPCASLAVVFSMAARQNNRRGFVLLGDPGAGKTTHLRRMALACVQPKRGPAELGLPDDVVPLFLPLRLLQTNDHLPTVLALLLARQLEVPVTEAEKVLATGSRWLFLLDGLDEVTKEQRGQVARWLERLLAEYPTSYFGVTCRYAGYVGEARLDATFLELHLRPLRDEAIAQFVHNWYRIVERQHGGEGPEQRAAANAQDLITRLDKASTASRRVNEMAANPLLLTIICLVHRDRGRILPDSRIDLYEDCLAVLLERWRGAKGMHVTWTAKEAQAVLAPLAVHLHEQKKTRLPEAELAPIVQAAIDRAGRHGKLTGAEFLAQVRDDSGVLVGWSNHEFGFLHLGFQEHLAAKGIAEAVLSAKVADRDSPWLDRLVAAYGDSWWEEVWLLLLAGDGAPLFGPLFQRLVTTPQFAVHDVLLHSCLAEARTRDLAPFQRLLAQPMPGALHRLWARVSPRAAQAIEVQRRSRMLAQQVAAGWQQNVTDASPWDALGSKGDYITIKGIEFVRIPAGTFLMGTPKEKAPVAANEWPHEVTIAKPFWLARTAVTNAQYRAFVEATGHRRPEAWKDKRFGRDDQPVITVSWDDAQAFCAWAGLRLPSEAEWEYACRAGTTTPFSFGANITTDQVNFDGKVPYADGQKGEYREQTVAVGTLPANAWGLHEMHGNVWEWCQDWLGDYRSARIDGSANEHAWHGTRVLRGGCWLGGAMLCRSAFRYDKSPRTTQIDVGFRPASSSP